MAEEFPDLRDIPPGLPLISQPYYIYEKISNYIDQPSVLGNSFMRFGGNLGYGVQDCRLIVERSRNTYYNFSPTQALLEDYASRNGTVRRVQAALVRMNHVAANIIPQYLAGLPSSSGINAGEPNSESFHCGCPNCRHNYPVTPTLEHMPNVPQQPVAQPPFTSSMLPDNRLFPNSPGPWSPPNQPSSNCPPSQGKQTSPEAQRRQPAIGSSTPSLRDVEPTPAPGYNGHIGHSPNTSPVLPRSEISSGQCPCDKCRLAYDPEQTHVLTTITSPPRSHCQLPSNLNNDLGRLGITDTSSARNSNSDKSDANARAPAHAARSQLRQSLNVKRENKPLCIKSNNDNTHVLGEQPDMCSACRQHTGEIPKRNTWPSDRREEYRQLDRDSSSSDGSITQGHTHPSQARRRDIEMIYTRTSFNNDVNDHRQGEGQTDQNGALNTNELNERLQSLNNRNNNGWAAAADETAGRRQTRGQDNRAGGNGERQWQEGIRNGEFVFVTFSYNPHVDDETHLQEIISMCRLLKDAGIRVKIDMDPETFDQLNLNKNDWLDQMTTQAKYVIVCISPTYYNDTQEHSATSLDEPQPGMAQLNARYIFNNLRQEYHGNGARNVRFIPVMFNNSGATMSHVPTCMRSTLVYDYPDQVQNIIDVILGQIGDEYRLPYRH